MKPKMAKQINNTKSKQSAWIIPIALLTVIAVVITLFFSKSGKDETFTQTKTESLDIPFHKQGELVFLDKQQLDTLAIIGIEIADNDQKRARGLMYRNSIPSDGGMLFVFDTEQMQSFWMKNTYISLDMLFINAEKEIVTIQPNTTPLKEWSYPSSSPAMYVIEVNAGFCKQHEIAVGDKIAYVIGK